MAFFFRTKSKSDIVKPTKDLLNRLWQVPKLQKASTSKNSQGTGQADMPKQTEEEAAKMLAQMKVLLVGNQGDPNRYMPLNWYTNVQIQRSRLPALSKY